MRFFKLIEDGFITRIGSGAGGEEITEAEYDEIMAVIQNKPTRTEDTDYRLLKDMTWVAVTIEEEELDDEISDLEALEILLGGAT